MRVRSEISTQRRHNNSDTNTKLSGLVGLYSLMNYIFIFTNTVLGFIVFQLRGRCFYQLTCLHGSPLPYPSFSSSWTWAAVPGSVVTSCAVPPSDVIVACDSGSSASPPWIDP